MTFFSAFFFHNGIDSWFNDRNRTVLQESLQVAESYIDEHKRQLLNDCTAVSKTLTYHIDKLTNLREQDFEKFSENVNFVLDDLCALKNLNSAILLDSSFNVIAHSKYSVALHFLNLQNEDISSIKERSSVILRSSFDDEKNIRAISCFRTDNNEYLYLIIEKSIDSEILLQAKNARQAYDEYFQLLEERSSLEIAFIFMFFIVGIMLLVGSIVVAILYSWRIVKPISNLIDASETIINGDLKARVPEETQYEEITTLMRTFNQMISQVQKQREDLVEINKQLDERIKFSSSVLAGVSSGVIGIDNNAVYVWNNAAEKLLGRQISFGEHIYNIIPEIEALLYAPSSNGIAQKEMKYNKDNNELLLSVKVAHIETSSDYYNRFVITFDDLTNMVMAQKKAAWSEIARRVAHEIKNPLTPIQLSAERIRRKYISQINSDSETFTELIDVIIRQVGDIKRLIDNFTHFAKLPDPILKPCNLYEICKQAVFFIQNASEDVKISLIESNIDLSVNVDERLIHQSIVNLIKNAVNALGTVTKDDKRVQISIKNESNKFMVIVEDNGPGLPKEKIESLATPYFTLMPKGTGLGLAIVKKIVQDHGGELLFGDSDLGGAKITISIPKFM
jgi:two-component system nitrogen regulation sensor histidine kinase NtrY